MESSLVNSSTTSSYSGLSLSVLIKCYVNVAGPDLLPPLPGPF